MTNKGLTPEAKYLLIRLLYLNDLFSLSLLTQDAAKRLGLSDAVLRKARNVLSELGYLTGNGYQNVTIFEKSKGRPRVSFRLTSQVYDELDKIISYNDWLNNLHPEHKLRLGKLLLWRIGFDSLRSKNVKKVKKPIDDHSRTHTFTAATRILLAVLYLHADVCGAVRELSLVEISKLTGMSSDRLDSQLCIIEEMGYLLGRVSGITHKQMFGHGKGIFFLNVCSDNLVGIKTSSLWLALNSKVINYYNKFFLGRRVYDFINDLEEEFYLSANEAASLIKRVEGEDSKTDVNWEDKLPELLQSIRKLFEMKGLYSQASKDSAIAVTDFYAGVVGIRMVEWLKLFSPFKFHELFVEEVPPPLLLKYLHSQIDYYVSILLAQYWGQIKFETLYVSESILSKIELKTFPFKDEGHSATDSNQKMAFTLFLYCISYQHAMIVKALVSRALPTSINFDTAKFALLPIKKKKHFCGNSFLISIHLVEQKERVEKIWAVQFGDKDLKGTTDLSPYCVRLFEDECVAAFDKHGYDLKLLNHIDASFSNSNKEDSSFSANSPS
ncbi:MAG: hypothetical protein IPP76_11085 [Moraxellaceae bacterium]|nr:hypothetical protein [Moraxellaceae bacterium]